MKVNSKLAFQHDYATEFGGELGKRLYRHYSLYRDGEPMIAPHISWDYNHPDIFRIDTCKQDKDGIYIFIDCKSRKDCHRWMEENWDKLCK
jgi:hypothetical protein